VFDDAEREREDLAPSAAVASSLLTQTPRVAIPACVRLQSERRELGLSALTYRCSEIDARKQSSGC
jgi:hypothetical protein